MWKIIGTKNKRLLAASLLIVGILATIGAVLAKTGSSAGVLRRSWESAFGNSAEKDLVLDVQISSSSVSSSSSGLDEEFSGGSSGWPTLLIDENAGKPEKNIPGLGLGGSFAQQSSGLTSSDNGLSESRADQAVQRWCDFSQLARASSTIVLNEVAWMGSSQGPNDEWIELKNISNREIEMAGWQLLNVAGSIKIYFAPGTIVAENGFVLARRKKTAGSEVSVSDISYSGALSNSGDWLKLFDDKCALVDELNAVDGWPAGDNAAKKTLERDSDALGWHESADSGGSPRAKNSDPVPVLQTASTTSAVPNTSDSSIDVGNSNSSEEDPPIDVSESVNGSQSSTSTAQSTSSSTPTSTTTTTVPNSTLLRLMIAEIQITGGPGATDNDYVRIHNLSDSSVDISGWRLRKRTQSGAESSVKVFEEGSTIAPGGKFTWANSADNFYETVAANISSTQTLSANNSVALLDSDGTMIDAIAWGEEHINPFVEGQAYPINPATGEILSRKTAAAGLRDAGNNAEDFQLLTPQSNSI